MFARTQNRRTAPAAAPVRGAGLAGVRDAFIEARFKADPSFAVQSGRHEFDGQMPDWSRAASTPTSPNCAASSTRCEMIDAAALTQAQRFEREYLRWVIDTRDSSGAQRRAAVSQSRLVPRAARSRRCTSRANTRRCRSASRVFSATRAPFRGSPPTSAPTCARRCRRRSSNAAPRASAATRHFFRSEMPAIFAQLEDETLKSDLTAATAAAAHAMDELTTWLESQRATATDDFALGAATFAEMLRTTERVDMPLEELELVGRKDLERNHAALTEACAAYAPRASLAACVDKMRANKPRGGTVEGARAQLAAAAPVRARQARSSRIPNQEQALVAESPPYNRGNFAYISIPGPLRKPGRQGDLLRGAAGREVERGRAQCLRAGQGLPAVSCRCMRSGPVTTCSRSSPMPIHRACCGIVVGLRLRRGLGALHRGDDVRRRPRGRTSRRCASACSPMPCCATSVSCPPSACTAAA